MAPRYVCIHGHFYQPPRENPWLEAIERQDSAYPYHDWNERISAECYAPNGQSRILDGDGRITRLVNNYSRISFNFGPTLQSWLEAHDPDTHSLIQEADRLSLARFGGHGSALAQVYNHIIMPLANARDRLTQVRWGKADFERRFGRPPEGMWLAETAVDLPTLDLLAQEGIQFTVLSPYQAARVRPADGDDDAWEDASGGRIDPTRAYECRLPSGRSIALFFYDGPIARAVAFEGLLHNGEGFAGRLLGAFRDDRPWPQLVHIATDGETYGHHSAHGDMGLAYALESIEARDDVRLTNYGEYLELHPPTHVVEIIENSSWSCFHGIERWRGDCGCNSGRAGWGQHWRGPLRAALDWLRDTLIPIYKAEAGRLFADPWAARDDYIAIVLDRRPENVDAFLRRHAGRALSVEEQVRALKLLEMQRNGLLMYTSCGWFFDELSGIETVQVIQYASRAVQLAEDLTSPPATGGKAAEGRIETEFVARLTRAKSNVRAHRDGGRVYNKFVRPARVDLAKVAAHYAVSALFHDDQRSEVRGQRSEVSKAGLLTSDLCPLTSVYCYTAAADDLRTATLGKARFATGAVRVQSTVTREAAPFAFATAHFGGMHLHGGVRPLDDPAAATLLRAQAEEAFQRYDMPAFVRLVDRAFDAGTYSLRSLFRDEQEAVLARITEADTQALETSFRQAYDAHAPVMHFLRSLDRPLPPAFQKVADFLINLDLRRVFAADEPDLERVQALLNEAELYGVPLDGSGLAFVLTGTIIRLFDRIAADSENVAQIQRADALVGLANELSFPVDLWRAQNTYYGLLQTAYVERLARAAGGDNGGRAWAEAFAALGGKLHVHVPEEVTVKLAPVAS
jgi:alpha-amylase/alpha-mannosidase (GH57 family)